MSNLGGGRNDAIDILKCLAALLITNSHMADLYPAPFTPLATGGAIGDALFFFASGFTISYSRGGNFYNWYKRRVNRIFPTIFAVAAIDILLFGKDPTIKDTVIGCGGWFLQCIFLFYALFWFVKRYLMDKLWLVYLINGIIVLAWYVKYWDYNTFILYNGTYLRWAIFFFSMLLGASIARYERNNEITRKAIPLWMLIIGIVVLLSVYYGYQLMETRIPQLKYGQLVLMPVLFAIVYCLYLFCQSNPVRRLYSKRIAHPLIYWISALCLEVYLCQKWIMPIGADNIQYFPLNVLFSLAAIIIAAYLLKITSNFLSQTFKTEDYNWKGIIKL